MTEDLLCSCWVVFTVLVIIPTTVQMYHGCGSISKCPNLPLAVPITIQQVYSYGPLYVTFVPESTLNLELDNICYTLSSLPDGPNVSLTYISRVYKDGGNQVTSYIISQPRIGYTRYGSSTCSFLDTPFANVTQDGSIDCNLTLIYRCILNNGCGSEFDVNPPIFGVSHIPSPISTTCIQQAKEVIRSFGFPNQEYITYPMQQPTQCVYGGTQIIT